MVHLIYSIIIQHKMKSILLSHLTKASSIIIHSILNIYHYIYQFIIIINTYILGCCHCDRCNIRVLTDLESKGKPWKKVVSESQGTFSISPKSQGKSGNSGSLLKSHRSEMAPYSHVNTLKLIKDNRFTDNIDMESMWYSQGVLSALHVMFQQGCPSNFIF